VRVRRIASRPRTDPRMRNVTRVKVLARVAGAFQANQAKLLIVDKRVFSTRRLCSSLNVETVSDYPGTECRSAVARDYSQLSRRSCSGSRADPAESRKTSPRDSRARYLV